MLSATEHRRLRNLILLTGGILLIGIGLYILARAGRPVPCVFHLITGLSCPGCGNTRAVLSLLKLDLSGALSYNMLFPLECFYLGWVYLHSVRRYWKVGHLTYSPPLPVLDWGVLILTLLWWVIRNILHI